MTQTVATPRLPPLSVPADGPRCDSLAEAAASSEEIVIAYHERTKHQFHRFAPSLGYMDWATQPDPFRRYAGAPFVRLPLPSPGNPLTYWKLYVPGAVPSQPLTINSLSLFFRYALSLTAWKSFRGSTWALRANPSSGNLHPTEGYAILPALKGLADVAGVYHYAPKEHGLERRASLESRRWSEFMESFPRGSFLVGLSSVHWREAWKYGERAFRYCQHDVGHALATLRIAAAALGWRLVLLDPVSDDAISCVLGLARDQDFGPAEREEPDLLAVVSPVDSMRLPHDLIKKMTELVQDARWHGSANVLSPEHRVDWRVIGEVTRAARRAANGPISENLAGLPTEEDLFGVPIRGGRLTAEMALLGRRSAVAMDGSTSIPRPTFFHMMARLIPWGDGAAMPWDAIPWRPRIHLALFVHRVDGLRPGLYALLRDPEKLTTLKNVMRQGFLWHRPPGCPSGLPLYLLCEADCRSAAATVSCGQDIAGDGAFSLGMIADYVDSLMTFGASFYRNLFWEAGTVGQVLYLEAEEAGIRSTGIGCYFDDPVHEVFGIATREWQSFYHFTVGGAVEDLRLTTLPAYGTR